MEADKDKEGELKLPAKKRFRALDTNSITSTTSSGSKHSVSALSLANERSKAWKRNVGVLYDFVLNHGLTWASLTCAFGAAIAATEETGPSKRSIYFSSRTASKFIPKEFSWTEGPPSEIIVAEAEIPRMNFTRRNTMGRFSESQRSSKIVVRKKIIHPGEVNRVRAFQAPYNHLILSKTESCCVFLWDTSTQQDRSVSAAKARSNSPDPWVEKLQEADLRTVTHEDIAKFRNKKIDSKNSKFSASVPDVTLVGHTKKAEYALDCCSQSLKAISGGSDAQVLVWSLKDYESAGGFLNPSSVFNGHTKNVEDCSFHPETSDLCCSVGDDRQLLLWDSRAGSEPMTVAKNLHKDDINCCAYNQVTPHYLLTGSSDTLVKLIDVRKLATKGDITENPNGVVSTLDYHKSSVLNVKWSPNDASHFASTCENAYLVLWNTDLDRIQEESPAVEFKHAGHRSQVVDFDWVTDGDRWLFSTVSDSTNLGGGTLQVWKISDFITQRNNPEFIADLRSIAASRSN